VATIRPARDPALVTSSTSPTAPRRRPLVAVALVVALAALAPVRGAAAQEPGPGPDPARTVFVLGDSVILGAQAEIEATLAAAGWTVLFDATVGRTTLGGLEEVLRRRTEVGGTIVIMLGHNDAADPQIFAPDADALLAELSDVPRVLWLTIHEVKDYYAQANRLLATVSAGRTNVQIVDWDSIADRDGVTNPDGLHLTPAGAQAMADLVLAAVEGNAPSPTTTPAGPPTSTSVAGATGTAPTSAVATTAAPPAGDEAAAPAARADAGDEGGGPSGTGTLLLVAAGAAAVGGLVLRRRQLTAARDDPGRPRR
jgi:lysophospholipase L1-like esterase